MQISYEKRKEKTPFSLAVLRIIFQLAKEPAKTELTVQREVHGNLARTPTSNSLSVADPPIEASHAAAMPGAVKVVAAHIKVPPIAAAAPICNSR
jgi:hypothetical protein